MNNLSYISGEFRSKIRETGFLDFFLTEHKELLRKNLYIAMGITLIFIFTDYIDFGTGQIFSTAVFFRLLLALICYLAVYAIKRAKHSSSMQNLLFTFTLLYVIVSAILFYLVPYAGYSFVISGILIVLAICLFLPQRFFLGLISSLLTSVFFLIPLIVAMPANQKLFFEGFTYLFAANVFGLVTFRELNKYKRLNYLMLLENRHRHEQLKIRHEIMQKDLDIARNIQHKLISQSYPQRNIYTMYHPVEKVGGDLIDIIPITDNISGIFLGDVSGHGVSAALMTVLIKAFLTRKLEELPRDGESSDLLYPSHLLKNLNKSIAPFLDNHFVSAFYATYNHGHRRLICSGAAHPPPMLLTPEDGNKISLKFLPLKNQFFPMGYFFDKSDCISGDCDFSFNLGIGSRLIFYSDGLFDAINYTYERAESGIESFSNTFIFDVLKGTFSLPPDQWMERLSLNLLEHRENFSEYDDISVVTASIT